MSTWSGPYIAGGAKFVADELLVNEEEDPVPVVLLLGLLGLLGLLAFAWWMREVELLVL
jgi:hypothetical protein